MYKYVKRFIDIILSLILIVLLLPLMIIVYIILKLELGGKIIFKQERFGLNKKVFTIYKFKSMKEDTTLSYDERITKTCLWIRRSGVDELPNIFNILKGDMSFVGPRPLMAHDDSMPEIAYNPKRYKVKPGVFGLAQYHGIRKINTTAKINYDLEYVDKESFSLDFKLFFLTIYEVIREMADYIINKY
jgi:lipopolysaccharide/colanic/teichoic acid biosynthesis glycosyltransferase